MTSHFLSVMETRSNTTELDNLMKEASSSPGELHSEHYRNWWNIIAEMRMVSVSISGLRVLRSDNFLSSAKSILDLKMSALLVSLMFNVIMNLFHAAWYRW